MTCKRTVRLHSNADMQARAGGVSINVGCSSDLDCGGGMCMANNMGSSCEESGACTGEAECVLSCPSHHLFSGLRSGRPHRMQVETGGLVDDMWEPCVRSPQTCDGGVFSGAVSSGCSRSLARSLARSLFWRRLPLCPILRATPAAAACLNHGPARAIMCVAGLATLTASPLAPPLPVKDLRVKGISATTILLEWTLAPLAANRAPPSHLVIRARRKQGEEAAGL